MARIEQLIIENYRGASSKLALTFDKDKPVTLVFGENGTGKTTIVDALDVLGNCSKGSLDDKSSTRARDHLPTIGKKAADVKIQGTSGTNSWNATLSGDTLTTLPETRPKIRVLRRSHLQKLIEAQPAQRYESLRHFIDVNNVERSENTLKDAASAVKADFDSAVKRRVDAESQLESVWHAEGKPNSNALEWAKNIVSQDTTKLENDVQQLRATYSLINKAETALAEWQQADLDINQKKSDGEAIELEIAQLPGVDAQQAINLAGILRQVSQHLQHGDHSDECPVCLQSIPIAKLKVDVQERLTALQKYDELQTKRETSKRKTAVPLKTHHSSLITHDSSLNTPRASATIHLGSAPFGPGGACATSKDRPWGDSIRERAIYGSAGGSSSKSDGNLADSVSVPSRRRHRIPVMPYGRDIPRPVRKRPPFP